MIGWNLAMTGSYQQALGFCQQALALHHQLGDKHSEPSTLDSLAYAHRHLGHDAWTQALAILDDLRHPHAEQVRTKLRQLAT
jgi:hypothetical protein